MNSKYEVITKNKDIVLEPKSKEVNSSLIFLHGLGDSAHGWDDLFKTQSLTPETTRIILLTAPMSPVSINGGAVMTSWFDLIPPQINKSTYNIADVEKNQARVIECINQEVKFHNEDSSKVFLGGFSQGAALSLHIGFESKHKLGGVLALSGFMFKETKINNEDLNVLITHGDDDSMIPSKVAEASYLKIKVLKNVSYNLIKNLEHSIDNNVILLIRNFLKVLVK